MSLLTVKVILLIRNEYKKKTAGVSNWGLRILPME